MSGVDSRTILDTVGAEKLCGRGDMLYAPVGAQKPQRVQGAFVSDEEVEEVVTYVKERNAPVRYDQEFETSIDNEAAKCGNAPQPTAESLNTGASSGSDEDSKLWDAVELAIDAGKISTSLLQRRLEVGYGRAAKIIDRMEEMGFVSAPDGNKPRKILVTREELDELCAGESEE
jgi:S-DNA-T family DNA segregation ATPase FtsK/SpoIIIE